VAQPVQRVQIGGPDSILRTSSRLGTRPPTSASVLDATHEAELRKLLSVDPQRPQRGVASLVWPAAHSQRSFSSQRT